MWSIFSNASNSSSCKKWIQYHIMLNMLNTCVLGIAYIKRKSFIPYLDIVLSVLSVLFHLHVASQQQQLQELQRKKCSSNWQQGWVPYNKTVNKTSQHLLCSQIDNHLHSLASVQYISCPTLCLYIKFIITSTTKKQSGDLICV